jgi:hypothetical protein
MKRLILSLLLALITVSMTDASTQRSKTVTFGPGISSIVPHNVGGKYAGFLMTLQSAVTEETQYYIDITYYTDPYGFSTNTFHTILFDFNPGWQQAYYMTPDMSQPLAYGVQSYTVVFVYP